MALHCRQRSLRFFFSFLLPRYLMGRLAPFLQILSDFRRPSLLDLPNHTLSSQLRSNIYPSPHVDSIFISFSSIQAALLFISHRFLKVELPVDRFILHIVHDSWPFSCATLKILFITFVSHMLNLFVPRLRHQKGFRGINKRGRLGS